MYFLKKAGTVIIKMRTSTHTCRYCSRLKSSTAVANASRQQWQRRLCVCLWDTSCFKTAAVFGARGMRMGWSQTHLLYKMDVATVKSHFEESNWSFPWQTECGETGESAWKTEDTAQDGNCCFITYFSKMETIFYTMNITSVLNKTWNV